MSFFVKTSTTRWLHLLPRKFLILPGAVIRPCLLDACTRRASRSLRRRISKSLIEEYSVDVVVFSYSDISHQNLMHLASRVGAAGADFWLLGAEHTQFASKVPVISVCAGSPFACSWSCSTAHGAWSGLLRVAVRSTISTALGPRSFTRLPLERAFPLKRPCIAWGAGLYRPSRRARSHLKWRGAGRRLHSNHRQLFGYHRDSSSRGRRG
jgi:hypothetical protein